MRVRTAEEKSGGAIGLHFEFALLLLITIIQLLGALMALVSR
jgi:hypothetical protein